MGTEKWMLKGTGKKGPMTVCIKRDPEINKVCIVPDLVSELGLSSSKVEIKKNCPDQMTTHYLQTCYSEGNHRISREFSKVLKILIISKAYTK